MSHRLLQLAVGMALVLSFVVGCSTGLPTSPTPAPSVPHTGETQEPEPASAQATEGAEPAPAAATAAASSVPSEEPLFIESTGPLSALPKDALSALNQRIESSFGTDEYTVVTAQKSYSGKSWCIVFDPPFEGQLMGNTLLYDYASIQPDGDSWNAMMIEDHQDGMVLKIFGCDAVYKGSSQ